jgi:hypothetical protein
VPVGIPGQEPARRHERGTGRSNAPEGCDVMTDPTELQPLATFCGKCDCGCPQLFVDDAAPADRRVVLTDDFGQQVRMSADQFASLVEEAKAGRLDTVAAS